MWNRFIIPACLAICAGVPSMAMAKDNGVGVKASTLGVGIEYERLLGENFGLRLGVNYFQLDGDFDVDLITYDASVDLQTASALVDWYPFAGIFRLTGGIMYNGNEADIASAPGIPVKIGDHVYTTEMLGTLRGTVTFNTLAPYAGIGWSSARQASAGFSVALDVGVLFQGSPDVEDFQATGPLAGIPGIQDVLDKEAARIEDELEPYEFYPVVDLTLTYRF